MYSILAIGAESEQSAEVVARLRRRRFDPRILTSVDEALELHRAEGADLVLVLLPLEGRSSKELLGMLRAQDPRAVIVVCGRDEEITGAPDALELGAFEYQTNPHADPDRLLTVIGIALGARRSDAQLRFLRKKDATGANWQTIIGRSAAMREVFSTVRKICHRSLSGAAPAILVTGETGTGKGLVAKAIHYNSARRSGAFVDINCAAMPPALMESELFGHTRGAFTDAKTSRPGLFEIAEGGTLFLDEIGTLPLELQGKLLSAIEEKTIRPVGATRSVPIDVQVIAATHGDLEAMLRQERFRLDLYHRLNVIKINLPPLRERTEDRVLLAQTFVQAMCREYGIPIKSLGEDARRLICSYPWPGNVRELRNQIERIVLLEAAETIRAEHFTLPGARGAVEIASGGDGMTISLPEESCPLELLEREVIRLALEKHGGNVSRTARYLDISRHTLIYRLKKHGLGADGAA